MVVAVRDLCCEKAVLENLSGCGDEVILVEGKNPSLQRNAGVAAASGNIIYFIDDDTKVDRHAYSIAERRMADNPDIGVLGGPCLAPDTDSFTQKSFAAVFASPWATGKSSARYRKTGKERETDEKELILCNLFVRKEVIENAGGFRQELYPNEENEFLNRVQRSGFKIFYNPEVAVTRSHRKNHIEFFRQCFTYGKGRAEQTLFAFDAKDSINTVPAFFLIYLIYLAFTGPIAEEMLPLVVYLVLNLGFSVSAAGKIKNPAFTLPVFINFIALHICYGAGFIYGLLRGVLPVEKKIFSETTIKIYRGRSF